MPKRLREYLFFITALTGFILFSLNSTCFAGILDSWKNTKAYKPRPVLFLHGFAKANPADWNPAKTTLTQYFSKYRPVGAYLETINFQDPNGSVDTYDSGKTNPQGNNKGWSDKLKDKINLLLSSAKYGAYTNKVNLVCHSMGGLAARWYLVNYSSNFVDKLILIGAPNLGSRWARLANTASKSPKIGWLNILTTNGFFSILRDDLNFALLNLGKIDIYGEAVDDMDPSDSGSHFLGTLNDINQPMEVSYYGIIGIVGNPMNWIASKDYYGGDCIVSKDSQLGSGYVSYKSSAQIHANHWREPEIAAKELDNKILKFLDFAKPELKITSPEPTQTIEVREPSVHIKGEVYKEYLPADTKLTISVLRQEDGYAFTATAPNTFLKPSNLWIPNSPDSPVAEFDELVNLPGKGTYRISCQVKNPAGTSSDIKTIWVKLLSLEGSYVVVHCHNPEGKEIASVQGMDSYSVEIYDGDTLIGYGAYDAETHNKPIAISAGTHTIKAKFNGMTKEQTLTFGPNETKMVTFMFEREDINIQSLMTTSGGAEGSVLGNVGVGMSLWYSSFWLYEGSEGEHYWDYISSGFTQCTFERLHYVGDPPRLYWTHSSSYAWAQTPTSFTCKGSADMNFNPPNGDGIHSIYGAMWFYGIDVSSVFTGILNFDSWFIQQVISYRYEFSNVASVYLRGSDWYDEVQLTPGQNVDGYWWGPQDYYLKTAEQKAWKVLGTRVSGYYYRWSRDRGLETDGFVQDIIANGLKFSSLPYDLTGSAI